MAFSSVIYTRDFFYCVSNFTDTDNKQPRCERVKKEKKTWLIRWQECIKWQVARKWQLAEKWQESVAKT